MVSSLPALGSVLPEMGSALATVGSELARPGSLAAGHGQFRWRSWSVGVAKAGKWLAFCTALGVVEKRTHDVHRSPHPRATKRSPNKPTNILDLRDDENFGGGAVKGTD